MGEMILYYNKTEEKSLNIEKNQIYAAKVDNKWVKECHFMKTVGTSEILIKAVKFWNRLNPAFEHWDLGLKARK